MASPEAFAAHMVEGQQRSKRLFVEQVVVACLPTFCTYLDQVTERTPNRQQATDIVRAARLIAEEAWRQLRADDGAAAPSDDDEDDEP